MAVCKHYKPIFRILHAYCKCLYELEGCGAGGMLHILLDDNNYEDRDIFYCLKLCFENPQEPESDLGIFICREMIKLTLQERCLFLNMWNGMSVACKNGGMCKNCITDEVMEDCCI